MNVPLLLIYPNYLMEGKYLITLLSTDYINDLNFKMQSGNWLSDAEQTDDYLNLVAFSSSNYNIGDVIDVSMGDVDGAIKGKIVGLAD